MAGIQLAYVYYAIRGTSRCMIAHKPRRICVCIDTYGMNICKATVCYMKLWELYMDLESVASCLMGYGRPLDGHM